MEKYSVLMSLYNKETPSYLGSAIDSMINQTVPPDEIVIVEDGPLTEALYALISNYQDNYPQLFKIIRNQENLGLGLSLNIGLAHCKNELIARMDTDDISVPERCEKQLKVFEENPSLSIVGANVDEFLYSADEISATRAVPTEHEEIYEFCKRRNAFNHPVVMYRKSKVLESGGYPTLRRVQDLNLFGHMLFHGCKAYNINESLLYFRKNEDAAKRRKNWNTTACYISTIGEFVKIGYSSGLDYIIVACAQIAIFLLPIQLQQIIYQKFLRKREIK